MRIVSFNTQHCKNYISGQIDFDVMARVITELDADVVGLNEMRGAGQDIEYTAQIERLSELTGIKDYYFAKAIDVQDKGPYGNGILSKIPILRAETLIIPDPDNRKSGMHYETRCILKAELEGGITVLVTHFGLNPDEQENALRAVMDALPEKKCILMGDFNVTPDNPVLTPIRAKMTDAADFFDAPKESFPSDKPNRKIDYIFASRDIEITSADIPPIVASDHRPHVATVKIG